MWAAPAGRPTPGSGGAAVARPRAPPPRPDPAPGDTPYSYRRLRWGDSPDALAAWERFDGPRNPYSDAPAAAEGWDPARAVASAVRADRVPPPASLLPAPGADGHPWAPARPAAGARARYM